jgi:hypothetical protein
VQLNGLFQVQKKSLKLLKKANQIDILLSQVSILLTLTHFVEVEEVTEQGVEENIWAKEGWSDGRVEKAA